MSLSCRSSDVIEVLSPVGASSRVINVMRFVTLWVCDALPLRISGICRRPEIALPVAPHPANLAPILFDTANLA